MTIALGSIQSSAQQASVYDDFEGMGNVSEWVGDNCSIDVRQNNPHQEGINPSSTVLKYSDEGSLYANVRFDIEANFDLSEKPVFSFKLYIPSANLTGGQKNQVSLKLQDGTLGTPWSTQSEIIKPVVLDEWQIITVDFQNDNYINLDENSLPPVERTDFNRVVIQLNGENNNDRVVGYIDDFEYQGGVFKDAEYSRLVWSDEFEDDGIIDTSKWFQQTLLPLGSSWYNGEIQHYTDREDNSQVRKGQMHIIGKKETFTDQGVTKEYTSARLNSKFAFQYGRVEVRAKLPAGVGTWPAIWMLGKNIDEDGAFWDNEGYGTTPWPACGEIDIIEHWGSNQNFVQSAIHTPSSFGGTVNKGGQTLSTASTQFHTYTLDWYPNKMVFSVDGKRHYTYEPNEKNSDTWPFDAEQYLLLNFAFLPSIESGFTEDTLSFEYVRVYQEQTAGATAAGTNNDNNYLINAPNPARDFTVIQYQLEQNSEVNLSIYDVNGQLIQTLVAEKQSRGSHQVHWDLTNLPSGMYYYSLETEDSHTTKRCVVYH
jgi:beta-glucanase (GH16 family)